MPSFTAARTAGAYKTAAECGVGDHRRRLTGNAVLATAVAD
jgi:hypothetical protein